MYQKNIITCLWLLLAAWLLWSNAADILGWCSAWISPLVPTRVSSVVRAVSPESIRSLGLGTNSWVLFFCQLGRGVALLLNTVLIYGKSMLYQISNILISLSITVKLFLIVTLYPVMYNYSITWKVLWWCLAPVRYTLYYSYVYPWKLLFRGIGRVCDKIHAGYEWCASRPEYMRDWWNGKLSVETNLETGKPVRMSLSEKMDRIIQLLSSNGRILEARQDGSDFFEAESWPKGLVLVRNKFGHSIGMGFLVRLSGNWCLVTAAHVALKCRQGFILSAGLDSKEHEDKKIVQKHVQIDGEQELISTSSMDYVAIKVPADINSKLGVSKVKMAKTPSEGSVISVYGYVGGKFVKALGTIGPQAANMGFAHFASTIGGFSGTPIYRDGLIVGIHSRVDGKQNNYGLSLDFLLGELEEASTWSDPASKRQMRTQEEFDEELDYFKKGSVSWNIGSTYFVGASSKETWTKNRLAQGAKPSRLMDFDWSDETPMDYFEAMDMSVFPRSETPALENTGDNNTTTSTEEADKKTETICESAATSTSSTPEEKATLESQPEKKKKRSRRSKAGNGPKQESTPSETVLESTPENSDGPSGSPTLVVELGSKPKSWTQAYTQELVRLAGIAAGAGRMNQEELSSAAKAAADLAFPRETSNASASSSKTTL